MIFSHLTSICANMNDMIFFHLLFPHKFKNEILVEILAIYISNFGNIHFFHFLIRIGKEQKERKVKLEGFNLDSLSINHHWNIRMC